MAYTIGSQKGKDKAKNMKTNETWVNDVDGSTWKKNADGSVSVTTKSGQTFDNAYPASSGGGNSQYTGYKIGSDYGKQQATNMGIGTTWTATDGSLWTKENDGSITVNHNGTVTNNAYRPDDYSTIIKQQIEAGVPIEYVQATLNDRVNKATSDPNLHKYAYDSVYDMANWYINQGKGEQWSNDYEADNPVPEYNNKFDAQMMAKLNEILNRDAFSYDVANDPLYQQYANMYRREGDRAMKETMAEAAAGAGGMNTYAVTAANQANSYYNSQLNDRIPELYQLAYDKYLKEIDLKAQDLGILNDMDSVYYNRYRDTMNDWRADKNFAYGAYMDAVNQGNWEKNFGYNDFWTNKNHNTEQYWKQWDADNYKTEWDWETSNYNDQKSEQEKANAQAEIERLISLGATTFDPDTLAKAGYTQAQVNEMIAYKKEQDAPKTTVRSSGNDYTYDPNDDLTEEEKKKKVEDADPGYQGNDNTKLTGANGGWTNGALGLGLGVMSEEQSDEILLKLVNLGMIEMNENGAVRWVEGVNPAGVKNFLDNQMKLIGFNN